MPIFSAGFLAGILLLYQLSRLPAVGVGVAALLLALMVLWRFPRLSLVAGLAVGFGWALLHAQWRLSAQLPLEMEGVDQTVVVRIVGLPREEGRRLRFQADVVASDSPLPRRLLLSWYRPWPEVLPGETWRLRLRLKRPRSFASPGAFDYAGWLFRQGIGATGYVRKSADNLRLHSAGWSVDRWRLHLARRFDEIATTLREPGLIEALALGIRDNIPPSQWETLIRTGTNHLLAISGLHIGLAAALGWLLARGIWRLFPRLALWLPMQRAATIAALLPASLYAALAGFAVPTQRALIMLLVASLALLLWRRLRPWSVLAMALLLVLAVDPVVVLAPGFWLSFLAVAAIVAFTQQWRLRGWKLLLGVQFVLSIALLPVTAAFFGQASLVSPLANLLAVPLVSLLVVPLVLGGILLLGVSPEFAAWPFTVADWLLHGLMQGLDALASLPVAVAGVRLDSGWALAFALLAVALLLAPRGLPGRWLMTLFLLPAVVGNVARPSLPEGEFQIDVLDVGQGLSVVARTAGHVLVYDTGARFSRRASAAASVVAPFLRQAGIGRVDVLVLSHGDNDHAGGEALLRRELQVNARHVSDRAGLAAAPNTTLCRAGDHWRWDGVDFEYLHPANGARVADNNRSCVLKISNGVHAALLPGDIETVVESVLLAREWRALRSDLLIAPHHGSATSSSPAFIDAVAPRWVVFSVGHRNRYGFPRPEVVARYRARHIRTLRTDHAGTVSLHFGRTPDAVTIATHRSRMQRWWQPPLLSQVE